MMRRLENVSISSCARAREIGGNSPMLTMAGRRRDWRRREA
jgi:hypothetical protein